MSSLVGTAVLSNFAQVRRPDLLRSAYPDLAAPVQVWTELDLGVRRGLVPSCDWSWLAILGLTEREQAQADDLWLLGVLDQLVLKQILSLVEADALPGRDGASRLSQPLSIAS